MEMHNRQFLERYARTWLSNRGYPGATLDIELNPLGGSLADGVAFYGTCQLPNIKALAGRLYSKRKANTPYRRVSTLAQHRELLRLFTLLDWQDAPVTLTYFKATEGHLFCPDSVGQMPSHDCQEMQALLASLLEETDEPHGFDIPRLVKAWWAFVIDQGTEAAKALHELQLEQVQQGQTAELF